MLQRVPPHMHGLWSPPGPATIAQGPQGGEPDIISELRSATYSISDVRFTLCNHARAKGLLETHDALGLALDGCFALGPPLTAFVESCIGAGRIPPRSWNIVECAGGGATGYPLPMARALSRLRAARLTLDGIGFAVAHSLRGNETPELAEEAGQLVKLLIRVGDHVSRGLDSVALLEVRESAAFYQQRDGDMPQTAEEAVARLEAYFSQIGPGDLERMGTAMQAIDPSIGPMDLGGKTPEKFIADMRELLKTDPEALLEAYRGIMGPAMRAVREIDAMPGPVWRRAT